MSKVGNLSSGMAGGLTGKQLRYLEQQVWTQILSWNTFSSPKQFHYSSLSVATQLIVYIKDDEKYNEFQDRLQKYTAPDITIHDETESGNPGGHSLEDTEGTLKVPVMSGQTRFAYTVFREYQLQRMNMQVVGLIQDILRELIHDNKFPFDGLSKATPYNGLIQGGENSEDEGNFQTGKIFGGLGDEDGGS